VQFSDNTDRSLALAIIDSVQGKVITYKKVIVDASEWNATTKSNLSFIDIPSLVHLKIPESIGTTNAIHQLTLFPNVEIAEPNLKYYLFDNDEEYANQWALNNVDDMDIDAPEAWEITTGSSDIVVAIIDSGIDMDHEDLSSNIWFNPYESGPYAFDGIDNDENGYIDDYAGWNFDSGNNNPTDTFGHGTHVAGIIGAMHNNEGKVKGVCANVRLMAVKSTSSSLDLSCLAPAVYYAVNNGAKIINASW
jgi:subtilisin family serine protease